jgi:hypothetical protein
MNEHTTVPQLVLKLGADFVDPLRTVRNGKRRGLFSSLFRPGDCLISCWSTVSGKARIWSRNQLPLESKFPMVEDAVNQLNLRSTILDGEIVALAEAWSVSMALQSQRLPDRASIQQCCKDDRRR